MYLFKEISVQLLLVRNKPFAFSYWKRKYEILGDLEKLEEILKKLLRQQKKLQENQNPDCKTMRSRYFFIKQE